MKINNIILYLILFLLAINVPHKASAYYASPVAPAEDTPDTYIGLLLGFGQNWQSGISTVNCENCQFENGVGFAYSFGLTYEKQFSKEEESFFHNLYYGGMLHISNRDISAFYREIVNEKFPSEAYYEFNVPITYKHTSDISVMAAGLTPFVSYYPIKFLFFRLGLDASFIFNNNTKHNMELLDKRKELPNGEIVDLYIPNSGDINRRSYHEVKQDEAIKNINTLQLSIMPLIGGNIYLTDKLLFSPSFSYLIPLTDISSSNKFSINSWKFNIEFRYNISISYKDNYKGRRLAPGPLGRPNGR